MDRGLLFALLAVNVVAAGLLYSRFSGTDIGTRFNLNAQTWISSLFPSQTATCGLLHWSEYALVSQRVVLPDGVKPAAVYIKDGKIASISDDTTISGSHVLNFKDAVIAPGFIDVHVHLNEPGRAEWEGITTGTVAAAIGGITTAVDMPLNSDPVTTDIAQLRIKQSLAKAKAHVNIGYWAGLVPENAGNHSVLAQLVEGGALGFKSFMCPSGINDFANVEAKDIAAALPFLKKTGVPFYVHAEVVSDVGELKGDPTHYETYLSTRPVKFERDAIKLLIELLDADTTPAAPGFVVHIAHLSDSGALPMIHEAQRRGLPITVETCAHYLTFSKETIPDGKTVFKCAPPIRDADNRAALIKAVAGGEITIVSSDHSPAPPSMKQMDTGNFMKAWGGISGIQYLLPATWSSLSAGGAGIRRLVEVLAEEPAKLAGLAHRKGKLAVGYDADITVWEPESLANTTVAGNWHRHKISPYTDLELKGKAAATIVNGHVVQLFGAMGKQPCGQPISKNA